MKSAGKRVIYDFGANDGSDISYYLLKADLVVAIEANPILCEAMRAKFSSEINQGRVVIENCVVSSDRTATADFFIPLAGIEGLSDHHSTFKDPDTLPEPFKGRHKYEKISLKCAMASEIVSKHGKAHYIKIDIEHADADILAELFKAGHRAKYISAESHSIRVLAELIASGKYNHFKLIEGFSVSNQYQNRFFDLERKRLKKAGKNM
jgi:FkbM family methyltransferase